jgi:hypothetical protein
MVTALAAAGIVVLVFGFGFVCGRIAEGTR